MHDCVTLGYLSFHPMAQCVVHVLKCLACRAPAEVTKNIIFFQSVQNLGTPAVCIIVLCTCAACNDELHHGPRLCCVHAIFEPSQHSLHAAGIRVCETKLKLTKLELHFR